MRPAARFALPLAAALLLLPAGAQGDDTPLLRVFLDDGTTLVSYGEYARVGDRIVLSIPLGESEGAPNLQLVSLPADRVDWARTERYSETVRAVRYAATRGEDDFALLTGEVARVLNEIALASDPVRRLQLAEAMRRRLNDWPSQHYGYRGREVREIQGLLDEAIYELRAATGGNQFDLNLVATVEPPPPQALLPDPTPGELIAQALSAAEMSDLPAERIALLRSTRAFIDTAAGTLSPAARRHAQGFIDQRLARELTADRGYTTLARELTERAAAHAGRGDVKGVQGVLASVESRDAQLGRQRPHEVRALVAALQDHLDAARRLRLARDTWRLRVSTYRAYKALIRSPLGQLDLMRAGLEDIRTLAGPDAETLERLGERAGHATLRLRGVVPPADLAAIHALLQSACQMAGTAARTRRQAVSSGEMGTAWNAASAAAGSLMLLARARDELDQYLAPPRLR